MRIASITFTCALIIVTYGCNSGNQNKQSQADSASTNNVILSRECYLAVDGADTAYLRIENRAKSKVTGTLLINYSGNPNNNGTLSGEFRGDTLFADYTFTIGQNKTVNRNPLAFLKDGSRMTLGVGTIETYLGRSYFAKGKPIEFERGRFKFEATTCEDESKVQENP